MLVELVEVLDERVVRLLVLVVRLGVADADAQQEAAGIGRVDAVEGLATGPAAAVQMLTMPVGELQRCRSASRMGSTHGSSAAGDPPAQIAP